MFGEVVKNRGDGAGHEGRKEGLELRGYHEGVGCVCVGGESLLYFFLEGGDKFFGLELLRLEFGDLL